jgi:hypothetical protein
MNRPDLESETTPPPHLKGRVLASLRSRGLVETRPGRRTLVWRIAAAAACAVIGFAGGLFVSRAPDTAPEGPRFLLLLYEDSAYQPAALPDERAAEYSAWARSLAEQGRTVSGEELASTSRIVAPNDSASTSNLGTLAGFFLVGASSEAEAVAIAQASPHVKYGGRVVVRPVIVR